MFKNCEHKNKPTDYMKTLRSYINYDNPDIYKGPVKTEIINKSHGNGYLHLKVFKILNPKKSGGQGTSADSDSARGVPTNQGNKNVRALIDETNKKIEEMTSEDILKRVQQMKLALEQVKRGIRHPSAKTKPSNIITPNNFEAAEIQRYTQEINAINAKYREIKAKEDADQRVQDEGGDDRRNQPQQNKDFLLLDESNVDYENRKNQYPLKDNKSSNNARDEISSSPDPKGRVSANDISAYNEEDRPSQLDTPINGNRDGFEDDYGDADQQKTRFKEDGGKGNLLNEMLQIQEQKKQIAKVGPKKKKEVVEGAEGTAAGESAGEADATNDTAGTTQEEKNEDEKFLDEDTGSVASSTKSLAKHLRMLRNALYENYLPPSINNLKISAKIVFSALLIITIVWYVYSKNIYKQLKDNIENIHSSKNRMNSLTDIGANVRILNAMN